MADTQQRAIDLRPQILNCIDEAFGALTVPYGVPGYNINAGEAWVKAAGVEHHLDTVGIDAKITMPHGFGVMTDYKYQVTLGAEFFSYKEQVEIGADITFLFGAEAQRQAVTGVEINMGWTPLNDRRKADLEQLINATETMALYFSHCMGAELYEGRDGSGVRPPAYFPEFKV
jgi:hypothetical protein